MDPIRVNTRGGARRERRPLREEEHLGVIRGRFEVRIRHYRDRRAGPEAAHWLVPYSVEAELTVTSNGGRSSWDGVHRFSVTREPERTVNSSDASRHRDRHIAELMREVMRQLERRASFRRE